MPSSQRPLNRRESDAWRGFVQMQELLRGRIEQYLQADSGLSNADYTILAALSDQPDGRQRAYELGQRLGWEKSRLHHQLSRMCTRGLVERYGDEGRASYAALTKDGRAALDAAAPLHCARVRQLVLDRLTAQQVEQLSEISRVLLHGLEEAGTTRGS